MNKNIPAIEGGSPTRKNFLIFGKPKITSAEIKEVVSSLKSGWIGTGPKVAKFESMFGEYVGAKYSVAVNSCTAGLHLCLLAFGIKQGDEVITSPMTFAATANVIEHVGAKPVFVDIDVSTQNIDVNKIEAAITKKTKAIIVVHMAGLPCDMDAILKIAKKHQLVVIEDAAHAIGASYKGRKIGTIGDATVFSFYATKNITTGEGGMVTTNSSKIAKFIQLYALHGLSRGAWKRYSDAGFKHYLVEAPGYKYNMMDLQASIGIHQLERFEKGQSRRRVIWGMYNKLLADLPVKLPSKPDKSLVHAHHLYTILVDLRKIKVSRDQIQHAIHAEGIGTGIHFVSIHLHPYYRKKYGFKRGMFPNAEYVSSRTISLPIGANVSNEDIHDVVMALRKVLTYYSHNESKNMNILLKPVINEK